MMLLSELVARHRTAEGTLYAVEDASFQGFRAMQPSAFDAALLGPNDALLVDTGAKEVDPWGALDAVPAGVPVILVLPQRPTELAVGRVVQGAVAAGLDFVEVDELEQIWGRQVAVVGRKAEVSIEPRRARRITWEWAVGDFVGHALHQQSRDEQVKAAATVDELKVQIDGLKAQVDELQSQLQERSDELTARIAELTADLDAAKQDAVNLRRSSALRLGTAVLAIRRRPIKAARDIQAQIKASRRRRSTQGRDLGAGCDARRDA